VKGQGARGKGQGKNENLQTERQKDRNQDSFLAEARHMTALDRIAANLAGLQVWADEGRPLPFIDEGHDFVVGDPMDETELLAIEREYGVILPAEYRAFLARFGDTTIGPGEAFRKVRDGLTEGSKQPFSLAKPFLGIWSPAHHQLSNEQRWEAYQDLLQKWIRIPKDHGVLSISVYGCEEYGVLVLNGPYRGQIWIHIGGQAYYGPFGGWELLHDESALMDSKPADSPREYSFIEWYENWLDVRLKMAGLQPW
jgi:hypothetical protein